MEDRDARLTILKQKQAAQGTAQNPSAVISLAELQAMQDEVLQVRVPDQVNEADGRCAVWAARQGHPYL